MKQLFRTTWYVLTLRCEEADRVACSHARGGATSAERFGAWAHRMLCRSCRIAHRQIRTLDTLLAQERGGKAAAEPVELTSAEMPGEVRARLLARLDDERSNN